MRTTLDIADDVLQAAKELARRQKKTTGEVISDLTRKALRPAPTHGGGRGTRALHGFRPFPRRGGIVTNELIDGLRDGRC